MTLTDDAAIAERRLTMYIFAIQWNKEEPPEPDFIQQRTIAHFRHVVLEVREHIYFFHLAQFFR